MAGHPRRSFASATSASPSGAPCASAVSCLLGLPKPMLVRTITRVGRSRSAKAISIAAESPARSVFPSATFSTFHPYARKRPAASSRKARSVDPSIVIRLSS